jgi:hypothetical protein
MVREDPTVIPYSASPGQAVAKVSNGTSGPHGVSLFCSGIGPEPSGVCQAASREQDNSLEVGKQRGPDWTAE